LAAPYTWDLSSLIPPGAKSANINLTIYYLTTAAKSAGVLFCWQYELGANPSVFAIYGSKGLCVRVSKIPALDVAIDEVSSSNDGTVLLGPSRKLYLAFAVNTGHSGYAMYKYYSI